MQGATRLIRGRYRRARRLAAACFALGLALATHPVRAADDQLWGAIRIPGGAAALRRIAGLGDPNRPASEVVRDLTRAWFGTSTRSGAEPRERVAAYLRFIARAEPVFAAWPNGLSAAASKDEAARDAFRQTIQLLGLRTRTSAGAVEFELDADNDAAQRRRWLTALGLNPALMAEDLAAGKVVRLVVPSDDAPLPVPALFEARVFRSKPALEQMVDSPQALLTYLGLTNFDRDTLAWVASEPAVFAQLMSDRAPMLAGFGHALRVSGGQVVVPGGEPAREEWEALVGAPVTDPARFVMNLLERQGGRLAHLYATVAACEPERQAFVLGLGPSGRSQAGYLSLVADWFAAATPIWTASLQPLFRPAVDPAFVLLQTAIVDDVAGPDWWPSVLTRVVNDDGWPSRPEDTARALTKFPMTAPWLVGFTFEKADQTERRFALVRFAQRVFADAPVTSAADVEIALRTLKDMPALALALERMGERAPATYAAVGRAFRRIAQSGGPPDVRDALRAWQGALAILEQIDRLSPIPPATRTRLLHSLAEAIPSRPRSASGQAAGWVLHQLLPALFADIEPEEDMEARVFRLMMARSTDTDGAFNWEGVAYRVDRAGPGAASAARLLAVMPGGRLEHLVYLDRAARRLEQPPESAAAIEATAVLVERGRAGWPSGELAEAVRNLRRIGNDRARATRERQKVLAALDGLAAELLPSWAYALAMSPTEQAARLFTDASRLHRLASRESTGQWEDFAWQLADGTTRTPDGAAIRGSLLGLDLSRAADHLVRAAGLVGRPVAAGNAIHELTVRALVDRVVIRAPGTAWDPAVASAVTGAIARGRERAASLASGPGAQAEAVWARELTAAGISQWRQNQLAWLAARSDTAAALRLFGMTDYWRLGAANPLPRGWGQSARLIDGCWCASGVDRRPVEAVMGYTSPYATLSMPDLHLRLAELAAEQALPMTVIEPMLPMAIQDLIDQISQFVPDDWQPMTRSASLTPERFEAYLLRLVSSKILAPPVPKGTER